MIPELCNEERSGYASFGFTGYGEPSDTSGYYFYSSTGTGLSGTGHGNGYLQHNNGTGVGQPDPLNFWEESTATVFLCNPCEEDFRAVVIYSIIFNKEK